MDASNLRRFFRAACNKAGIGWWTPYEMRYSAASLMSAAGVPLDHDGNGRTVSNGNSRSAWQDGRERLTPIRATARWTRDAVAKRRRGSTIGVVVVERAMPGPGPELAITLREVDGAVRSSAAKQLPQEPEIGTEGPEYGRVANLCGPS